MSSHISLVTQQHSPKLANSVNASSATALINRYPSATPSGTGTVKPISVTATTGTTTAVGGTLVVPSAMNYLKVFPWWVAAASANTPTIRVVGWSYAKDSNIWIPHLLCNITCTLGAGTATINGTVLSSCASFTNSIGDAKLYNATSLSSAGFFVVDTLGFEQIELCFQTITTARECNAHVSEI